MTFKTFSRTAAALLLSGAAAAPALAQQGQAQPAQQPPMQQAAPDVTVDDAEIDTFVDAAVAVQETAAEWQAKLQSAGGQEEAMQIQQQAQAAMEAEIEASGMSTQRYNEIAMAAEADPELAARLQAAVQSETGGAAGQAQ